MRARSTRGRPQAKVFLLEYDRQAGRLVRLEDFGEDRAELAAKAGSLDREIVTLENKSIDVQRRTQGSYFGEPDQLAANFFPEIAPRT